jgi:hypothetical protein
VSAEFNKKIQMAVEQRTFVNGAQP